MFPTLSMGPIPCPTFFGTSADRARRDATRVSAHSKCWCRPYDTTAVCSFFPSCNPRCGQSLRYWQNASFDMSWTVGRWIVHWSPLVKPRALVSRAGHRRVV
mmetsp:Transcript_83719/g.223942  ORF Transcript_83719/g.223942 Transcript_83719/m.223942 type:complete len:102 (+) Transcript_83719:201-506(+)